MFFSVKSKTKQFLAAAFTLCFLAFVLLIPVSTRASTYGGGSFTGCKYSMGCTDPDQTTSTSGANAQSGGSGNIVLNDYSEYFSIGGKQFVFKAGQVIYFKVTKNGVLNTYSITFKSVGTNFVDLYIGPPIISPRLYVEDIKEFDVTGDGQKDIEISLQSVSTDRKAEITFRSLSELPPPPATTGGVPTGQSGTSWLGLLIPIGLILLGLIIVIWLAAKRRKRNIHY